MRYIGDELRNRMDLLSIDVSALSEMTFIDEDVINDIIDNKLAYEEIDEFDLSLICNALHCDTRYFIDDKIRNNDLLISTMNRGMDTVKSKMVKAKIQDFLNDYAFVNDILMENE